MDEPRASPVPDPRRQARWPVWRWLLIGLLTLAAALVLALWIGVEIIRRGDRPRRLVIDELHRLTGMQVRLDAVHPRWNGHTTLTGLRLTLPLQADPLLTAQSLEVRHQPLLALLWSGEPQLRRVEVAGLELRVQPDEHGRWNAAQAMQLLAGAAGAPAPGGEADWARVELRQGTITVLDAQGRTQLRSPFTLRFAPLQAMQQLDVQLPGLLTLRGQVSPRPPWLHELRLNSPDAGPLLKAALPDRAWPALAVNFTWRGQWREAALEGLLSDLLVGTPRFTARGPVALRWSEGRLGIEPAGLVLLDERHPQSPLTLRGGSLLLAQDQVVLRALGAAGLGHEAQLTGRWDLDQGQGRIEASYRGTWPPALRHSGVIDATVHLPRSGPRRITLALQTQGELADTSWRGLLRSDTSGLTWDHASTALRVEQLALRQDRRVLRLDGLAAWVEQDGSLLHLRRLDLPDAQLARTAAWWQITDGRWALASRIERWQPRGASFPVNLRLDAGGVAQRVERLTLLGDGGGWHATLQGTHHPAQARPLSLEVQARYAPAGPEAAPVVQSLSSRWQASGSLRPLALQWTGRVEARSPRWSDQTWPDVQATLRGEVTPQHVTAASDAVDWLAAQWNVQARYDLARQQAHVEAQLTRMDIGAAMEQAGVPVNGLVAGRLDAQLSAVLQDDGSPPQRVEGQWQVTDLHAGRVRGQRGRGRFTLEGRSLTLRDLQLSQADGEFSGEVRAQLTRDLRAQVRGGLRSFALHWPEQDLTVTIDGQTDLAVNLRQGASRGEVAGRFAVDWRQRRIGTVNVAGRMLDHDLLLEQIDGELLGGTLQGVARLALNDPLNSSADIRWQGVDGGTLQQVLGLPESEPLAGELAGSLTVAISQQPRALEPLQARLQVEPGLVWRGSTLGTIDLTAFIGPQRLVIDRGSIELLGGRSEMWLQWVRRAGDHALHLQVQARDLDLTQAAQLGGPMASPPVGRMRLDGSINGMLGRGESWFGRARLQLERSDLIGLAPVAALYDTLNLGQAGADPTGGGTATLSLGGNTVTLSDLHYFNRGTEIIGEVAVRDVWSPDGREVSGVAAGAARPLRDLGLPGVRTLDQLLRALQGNTAAVRIEGHLREGLAGLRSRSVPLDDLSQWFGRVLLNQGPGLTP
jgi:hypothetical protein